MPDMDLQKLDRGLLTITMNRPDRRNALNPDMTRGLVEAARRAAEDHEVRAVLLKGAGGTFCVGGDVKSMAEGRAPLPFEAKRVNLRRGMEVSRILHQMAKPVVAQVDGAAAGAGLSIALANIDEMIELAEHLEGQLTATLQMERDDVELARKLLPTLERKAGRILANGFPTGVEVSHAMVHGGPFPATSDPRSTSVGTLAIERFLRPVCYQDLPDELLP